METAETGVVPVVNQIEVHPGFNNADAVEGNERMPYHDRFALDRIEEAMREEHAALAADPRLPRAERGENMLYAAQANSKALQRVTQYIPAQFAPRSFGI